MFRVDTSVNVRVRDREVLGVRLKKFGIMFRVRFRVIDRASYRVMLRIRVMVSVRFVVWVKFEVWFRVRFRIWVRVTIKFRVWILD